MCIVADAMGGHSLPMPEQDTDEFLPTRRSLLARLGHWSDAVGWRDFFDTYGRFIFSASMRCGLRRDEAEEVVQEVVVSVAKKMHGFIYDPVNGSFKAWLMRVIHSRSVDFLRRKGCRIPGATGGEGGGELSAPADLETLWDEEWRRSLLDTAVARVKEKVKPRQFQVFDLSVNQGLDIAAVARALNISQLNVRVTKHRIAKMLVDEINKIQAEMNC